MSREIEGMKFATMYSKHERYYTNPGSRMANDYEIQIDKKGHKTLHKVGEHNIWDEIQSYKAECDIGNIIAKAAAGDLNALNQRKGVYADISNTPRNLAEAQNNILKLQNEFNKLPAEIRDKFDNSKEKFVHTFGTDEWLKNMGFEQIKEQKAPSTEKIDFVPGATEAAKNVLTPEG